MFDGLIESLGLGRRKIVLSSPLAGRVVSLSCVNDATFAGGLLGEGVAIEPTGNRVIAPADAKIEAIFPTGYAVALHTKDGLDVLIHIGLDTARLSGDHFRPLVQTGDTVKRGDVLIEFDREAIEAEGLDIIVPVLLRNAIEFASLKTAEGRSVSELDRLIIARER